MKLYYTTNMNLRYSSPKVTSATAAGRIQICWPKLAIAVWQNTVYIAIACHTSGGRWSSFCVQLLQNHGWTVIHAF